ncbi:MAG TPA: SpoIIE family protein phosphatase [Blastocatellia bacterium]|nr:SpoIIE family protein phosphatase [Blastocatellia bacterium]
MRRRVLLILIWLFYGLMLINAAVTAYETLGLFRSFDRGSHPGWELERRRDRSVIYSVSPGGPAANVLRRGDEILTIDGKPVKGSFDATKLFGNIPPGSTYRLVVRRGDEILPLTLGTQRMQLIGIVMGILITLVIPAIFLPFGLALLLLKPSDKLALLLALMFGAVTGLSGVGAVLVDSDWLAAVLGGASVCSSLIYPIFFHFFLLFPDPTGALSPLRRRFPRLEWYLYLPFLLIILPDTAIIWTLTLTNPDRINTLIERLPWAGLVYTTAVTGYIVAGLVSLLVNYREAGLPLRRKMRVAVAGSIAGFAPILLLIGCALLSYWYLLNRAMLLWLGFLALACFPLFPLSLLYSIVRHQVIPVRLIIRRGVRYLFVRQGSILLELIVVGVALTLMLNFFLTKIRISPLAVGLCSGAGSIAVWQITQWLHYRVIAPAIDRAFFRQGYNAQEILSELSQALRVMSDWREETLTFVGMKIQEALQTENITIFLRDDKTGDYHCAVSTRQAYRGQITVVSAPDLKLPRESLVLQLLSESSRSLRVDFDDPNSWAFALVSSERHGESWRLQECETLKQVGAVLILPIATNDQLLGAISLGPRLGDLPFSREDQDLVRAAAAQLSFAIENAQLVRHKAEEERMRRELEFASDVQQRLFPQCPPHFEQLELSGICHPARDVGGDYYDFLELENGQVGIAVADVSGKGISAALLMSVVQASLRAQAPKNTVLMTDLISSMNRLLCQSTDTSHYATFFYAQLDPQTRRLTYVNAGHNPPMLLRAGALRPGRGSLTGTASNGKGETRIDAGRISPVSEEICCLLTTGGPVIGLLEECVYSQGTLELHRGDILVAYTDGVSEARNPQEEEFGEERLMQIIIAQAHLSADRLREQIVQSVRAWQCDAPQHDDMTMVIVKVK